VGRSIDHRPSLLTHFHT